MTETRRTLRPEYFDSIYASNADPWKFATSAYEQEKYAVTLAALPKAHYDSCFEVGCSIGVLTRKLARRCGTLLAVDAAAAPLAQARERCADLSAVHFEQMYVPREWPETSFDLIVLSEVVYYFDPPDVSALAEKAFRSLRPGGDIVLVHWTGATDYPLSGDEAAERFIEVIDPALKVVRSDRCDSFRIDVLSRR